jgi:hypothetical protein
LDDEQMSRGEMIRRLDDAARTAADALADEPVAPDEQRAIASSLAKLLPLVADSLQNQLSTETAAALVHDQRAQGSPPTKAGEPADGNGAEQRNRASAEEAAARIIELEQALGTALEHVTQLEQAVQSRDVIGHANGVLMERYETGSDEAFAKLVRGSQALNVKLAYIAARVARP